MPTQVQNIVLPPIKKIVPLPPKPAEEPSPRREEFEEALKTARKKSEEADKAQSPKEKTKETKTESKDAKTEAKKTSEKVSSKTSSKSASKTAKQTKTAKAKNDKSGNDEPVDEADVETEAEETAAADAQAELTATDETEESAAQTKVLVKNTEEGEPAHHDDQTKSANEAAAGQLVQPIDRNKEQNPRHQQSDGEDADENDADAAAATIKPVDGAAKTADASQLASADTQNASDKVSEDQSSQSPVAQNPGMPQHQVTVAPIDLGGETEAAPKTPTIQPTNPATDASSAPAELADQIAQLPDHASSKPTDPKAAAVVHDPSAAVRDALASQTTTANQSTNAAAPKAAAAPPPPPEVQFAQSNHDKIVTSVQTQLLPHGGAMQIRLDPPELGALRVMVEMRDGVMSATFQTSNEEATQLLSHSLNQLKHVLESQGVSVERLQVQQAPKNEQSSTKEDSQQQQRGAGDDHAARQEQQRKEMMRRMWRRVSGAGDPIDYLA